MATRRWWIRRRMTTVKGRARWTWALYYGDRVMARPPRAYPNEASLNADLRRVGPALKRLGWA